MPPPPPTINIPQEAGDPLKVAFGSFLRLYDEDSLLRAIPVPGLTLRGLRALLRTLHVPVLEIRNTRLVDGFSLFLALRAVTRIGEPDFLAPDSKTRRRNPSRLPRGCTSTFDLETFRTHWRTIAMELMVAQRSNRLRVSDRALGDMAATAVTRMMSMGHFHAPLKCQSSVARGQLHSLQRDGTLPPWSLDDATPTPPIPPLPLPTPPAHPPH